MFDKIFGPPTEVLPTQIYVQLLNEGTVVYRPAPARERSTNTFEILRPDDYDPADEQWEFPPASVVRVALKEIEGKQKLVAVAMPAE